MITLVKIALNWLYSHATAKLYLSQTPVGRRLGGNDVQSLPNEYFVLDIRVADKILVLGYFELT